MVRCTPPPFPMFRIAGCLALVLLAATFPVLQADEPLPSVLPQQAGMDPEVLNRIDGLVQQGIEEGEMAGCVVAIGHQGKLVLLRAYGNRQVQPDTLPMTEDAVFDLASLTKPIATATSVMVLVERGEVRLRDRVSTYLPEFAAHDKDQITVEQLLTHQGGLIPDNALKDYEDGPEEAFRRINELTLHAPPGERFIYTDVGFIVLARLVEKVSGKRIDQFARENIFEPLGMSETGYVPGEALRKRAVATEQREGRWMVGEVHDPRAWRLDGVAGHAGLFSTAKDLARYAQMMLNGGSLGDATVLSPAGVDIMTRDYRVSSGIRGLGWDKKTGYSSNRGELFSKRAFGHGGFTGTSIWMDPEQQLFVIFLSTRLHPDGKGYINGIAGRVGTVASAAIRPTAADDSNGESPSR